MFVKLVAFPFKSLKVTMITKVIMKYATSNTVQMIFKTQNLPNLTKLKIILT